MGRAPCCDKVGLKKGPWTPEEDQTLISFIQQYGHSNWRALPKQAGLLRCGKSCRLRWMNYLKPDIKRGNFTKEEENIIVQLHQIMGNRWSAIASKLPGRTDNEIKNVWHTHLKKKFKQHQTTKPKLEMTAINNNNVTTTSNETTSVETSHQCVSTSPQQSYNTSDDFSSFNEVSSLQSSNKIVTVNKDDDQLSGTQQPDMDYFPIIDDTFWSYNSDGAYNVHTSFPSNDDNENQWKTLTCDKNVVENFGENMDFWFDVFLTADGAPELLGF